jgi:two-component system sensor histidine kinase/response regulator
MVILQVEDTGIGIADSKKPLLFQKFQQLDATYQRSYEGLGLGLALTKHLVELHQGWIDVESTEGKGSIFTIELPQQNVAGRLVLPAGIGASESAGRIVLIEDQEDIATLICELLTATGYQVIWMVEPSTAIDQIQFLQPLAALISVNLAGMDSYEIIRHLRHHPPTQEIKILLLAQPTSPEGRQPYLDVGADAYLTYPIEPQHLLHKVRTLLTKPAMTVS